MTPGPPPVRWGVLSTGRQAAAFAEDLMLLDDAELVAVGSRTAASARAFAARYAVERAYGGGPGELAADPDVDLVYVASVNAAHHGAVRTCLEAGKHVLCEKPLTTNVRDAQDLMRLAEARGLLLMEAMWTRCLPAVRRAARLVADGAVGTPHLLRAATGGRAPAPALARLRDPEGGGALLDSGVYPLALADLLLGTPQYIDARSLSTAPLVDDTTALLLGYPSGAMAELACSFATELPAHADLSGGEARIELPAPFYAADRVLLHPARGPSRAWPLPPTGRGYTHEASEAMRCVRAGLTESPLVPWSATLGVLTVTDAVRGAGSASSHRARHRTREGC
ncbi:Gfo/Idh/MocA family oxidoreductase [Streptomyces sp. NPDC003036]|uniref:Gfo/Idh/MocA family protein n=1 Tax=Streptomyces sp. NPDC003036 TaxID=3154442 RepID=UPI0033ABF327